VEDNSNTIGMIFPILLMFFKGLGLKRGLNSLSLYFFVWLIPFLPASSFYIVSIISQNLGASRLILASLIIKKHKSFRYAKLLSTYLTIIAKNI
jgi:hypothetical protein